MNYRGSRILAAGFLLVWMVSLALCGTSCGGGENNPVYNDHGECIANCPTDIIGGEADAVDESGDSKLEDTTSTCGDGKCEEGEDCNNCEKDCGCTGNTHCATNGACVYESCGNGACDEWEDCGCVEDCPCNQGYTCKMVEKTWCGSNYNPGNVETSPADSCEVSGEMVRACVVPKCGDGKCDGNQWNENCQSCPEDCGCAGGEICSNATCQKVECNNDGTCDSWENCGNCLEDCPCSFGKYCDDNTCKWEVPPTCGDGTCNTWENCGKCPADCGCPENTACTVEIGQCEYVCPADATKMDVCKPQTALEGSCQFQRWSKYSPQGDLIAISKGWKCYGGYNANQDCGGDDVNVPPDNASLCQEIPSREELLKRTAEAKCRYENDVYHDWVCNQGLLVGKSCWNGPDTNNQDCHTLSQDKLQEVYSNPNWPWPPCQCWNKIACTLANYESGWHCNDTQMDFSPLAANGQYCSLGYEGSFFFDSASNSLIYPAQGPVEKKLILLEGGTSFEYTEGSTPETCLPNWDGQ